MVRTALQIQPFRGVANMLSRLMTSVIASSALLLPTILTAGPARAQEASLVSVKTPRGVKQAFILIKPAKPVASVILFAGGHGGLRLKSATSMGWGAGNFLVRTRDQFAAQGFMVAVVDAPSDYQSAKGMNGKFRMSGAHANDIGAVVDHLKKQADVPVWLVGTSMGTFSAAGVAIGIKSVNGVVLTSTITRAKPQWDIRQSHPNGVASMRLSAITVPTLIVSHRKDACDITPAADAPKLTKSLTNSRKVDVVLLEGGSPPQSDPCQAKSAHGFLGIEGQAIARIAAFIKAN
jgi:pimeloyl-ACP methyl ester carboxylesterase